MTDDAVGTNMPIGYPAYPGRPLSRKEVEAIYDEWYRRHGRRVPSPEGGKAWRRV